jgi:hypothetical protein
VSSAPSIHTSTMSYGVEGVELVVDEAVGVTDESGVVAGEVVAAVLRALLVEAVLR